MLGNDARRIFLGALALSLLLIQLAPVLLSDEVTPTDLANHMGRIHILAGLASSAELRALYDVSWHPTPNLAADLLMTPLALLIGTERALRVFVAFSLLLFAAAFALLYRVSRARLDALALLGVPLAYNYHFNSGFINYHVGLCAAMLSYAVWLRALEGVEPGAAPGTRARLSRWRAVVLPLLALATYLMHLGGFAFLMVSVGVSVLTLAAVRRPGALALGKEVALLAAMAIVPCTLYLRFSPGALGGEELHRVIVWGDPEEKLLGVLRMLRAARPIHDVILFGLISSLSLLGFLRRAWTGPLPRLMVTAAGGALLLVALALPRAFDMETGDVDLRAALPALLLLCIGLPELPRARPARYAVALLLIAGALARSTGVMAQWRRAGEGVSQSRELCGVLPARARVITLNNEEQAPGEIEFDAGERHGWAYCLLEKPLFFPALFHVAGSQPLRLRLPSYEGIDTEGHFRVKNAITNRWLAAEIPWQELWTMGDYLWMSNWNLMEANPAGTISLSCFEEVGRRPRIVVYRMRKELPGCPLAARR